MTLEEYVFFSKCRSQNFHNSRHKFVEWLALTPTRDAAAAFQGMRISDEVLFVLQHLAWELVGRVTLTALVVRRDMQSLPLQDAYEENIALAAGIVAPDFRAMVSSRYARGSLSVPLSAPGAKLNQQRGKRQQQQQTHQHRLKQSPLAPRLAALQPIHILEAARRLHERALVWG